MITNSIWAIVSVILVSLLSIVMALPLLIHKKISKKILVFLLSVSVGVMLGSVFLNFIPEIIESGYSIWSALNIMVGFIVLFVLEKFVHWHHSRSCEHEEGHSHAYHIAPINLIGDGIHNFIDGLVIAGSYTANITLGIAATISIIFHEAPQEIADLGILLYSGLSKKKALLFNFLSAITAILGTVLGLVLVEKIHSFTELIIPFAAGNLIYIAASNLVPQLHRHCKLWDTVLHVIAILFGIGIVLLVTLYGPAHVHG